MGGGPEITREMSVVVYGKDLEEPLECQRIGAHSPNHHREICSRILPPKFVATYDGAGEIVKINVVPQTSSSGAGGTGWAECVRYIPPPGSPPPYPHPYTCHAPCTSTGDSEITATPPCDGTWYLATYVYILICNPTCAAGDDRFLTSGVIHASCNPPGGDCDYEYYAGYARGIKRTGTGCAEASGGYGWTLEVAGANTPDNCVSLQRGIWGAGMEWSAVTEPDTPDPPSVDELCSDLWDLIRSGFPPQRSALNPIESCMG